MNNNLRRYIKIFFLSLIATTHAFSQNQRPNADAGKDTVIMDILPVSVMLDGSNSTDPDGTITSYYWVVDGDTVSTDPSFEIELDTAVQKFKLIVVDDSAKHDVDYKEIFIGHPTNNDKNRIPFRNGTNPLFASGMNIAWFNFSNDLTTFDFASREYYTEIMDSIASNGGNAIRWWLHTNGANSPQFDSTGHVTSIDWRAIQSMKNVLDLAFDYDIAISMCLWSFDMLQNGQRQDPEVMKKFLQDSANIQSYIDNALIPILDALGDHPAVLTWEIFNEPEGMTSEFGWSSAGRIEMPDVQRFVNMCAGAIHRNTENALVSNGSWSFKAATDVGGNIDYYKDEALVAAGGDPDGILDFLQVHFYAEHFDNSLSPFHRPASFWGVDKPIVIGEFRSWGIEGKVDPALTTVQAYQRAIDFGYAGALGWSWTDSPKEEFTETVGAALLALRSSFPSDVTIDNSAITLDRIPVASAAIPHLRRVTTDLADIENYITLTDVFSDEEDGTNLTFGTGMNTDSSLVTVSIDDVNAGLNIDFKDNQTGLAEVGITAMDSDGWRTESSFYVMVKDPLGHEDNLAFLKPVYASSTENNQNHEIFLNDGSQDTRWSSTYQDDAWVYIDFEQPETLNYLRLYWEVAYAASYEIQTCEDMDNCVTVYSEAAGDGGTDVIVFDDPITTRYLRVKGIQRATQWGYSMYELVAKNLENTPPSIVTLLDDFNFNLSEIEDVQDFLQLTDLFTDLEDSDVLTYHIENDNEDLVTLALSPDGNALDLLFGTSTEGRANVVLTATDPFGASAEIEFTISVIDDILSASTEHPEISLFPNPTSGLVTVNGTTGNQLIKSLRILDLEGKTLKSIDVNQYTATIDITSFPAGIYLLEMQTSDGLTQSKLLKK